MAWCHSHYESENDNKRKKCLIIWIITEAKIFFIVLAVPYMPVANSMLQISILLWDQKNKINLDVVCCIRCVMKLCFSLVSSVLRYQLTAVLGDSFVLLPYLCAQCNSETSHPTCSPHPPSLYIKLNLRSTSGNGEVRYIYLPTQGGNGEVGGAFWLLAFM